MQQRLALLFAHVLILVSQHEAHRREEVCLARAIAADNDVAAGRERLGPDLVLVCLEALDRDVLDVTHGCGCAGGRDASMARLSAQIEIAVDVRVYACASSEHGCIGVGVVNGRPSTTGNQHTRRDLLSTRDLPSPRRNPPPRRICAPLFLALIAFTKWPAPYRLKCSSLSREWHLRILELVWLCVSIDLRPTHSLVNACGSLDTVCALSHAPTYP